MKWLLLWFLGTTGMVIVGACIVFLFLRHRLHRLHRVDPKVPTAAPVTWVADPRHAARLHRRLARIGRASGAVADDHRVVKRRRVATDQPPLVESAEDVRRHAVRLDHELTRVVLLTPAARKVPLHHLSGAVDELERACIQLVHLSAEVRTPPVLASERDDIVNAAAQIDRLTAAHAELLQLDVQAGLVSSPVTRPFRP